MVKEQLSRMFGFSEREIDHANEDEVVLLDVEKIHPNPYQPRTVFDEDKIDELSQTIRIHGVIQPIIVRVVDDGFQIIAGERRWRATKKIGIPTIPAIVRNMNDTQVASIALIENLQREGLSAIEEAVAYQKLLELHGLTQESLAQRLGKAQSTVANKLRLLQLPEAIQQAISNRVITERHARTLLSLHDSETQVRVLEEIVKKNWNVKQTEARVKQLLEERGEGKKEIQRRYSYSKDMRLALNTIRQSIDLISKSGLNVQTDEKEQADYYLFTIRIPKK